MTNPNSSLVSQNKFSHMLQEDRDGIIILFILQDFGQPQTQKTVSSLY